MLEFRRILEEESDKIKALSDKFSKERLINLIYELSEADNRLK